jgi:hypothetical protein
MIHPTILAQKIIISTVDGQQEFTGPLEGIDSIASVINIVLPFIYALAGLLLFLYLAWGGYDFLMSQGSPEKVKSGQAKITAAIIGFILLVLSYLIVKVLSLVLGFNSSFI